jgi:cytochrome b pre-mRNA-processing protein 3
MYLLTVRFRCFPKDSSQTWQQHLLDHFFYAAEDKMVINHNMSAKGTRQKYLKDLFVQWRGLLAAYDEGIAKGDTMLASAIWRNVFKADEDVDVKGVAAIVSYMRRNLRGLDLLDDHIIMSGGVEFGAGDPSVEMGIVRIKSKMLDLPFTVGKVVNEPVAPAAKKQM